MKCRILMSFILMFLLSGCGESSSYIPVNKVKQVEKTVEKITESSRFEIYSYGEFKAGYNNNNREILIIRDTETKKEYIAITGCGVTEVVRKGKTTSEE